MNKMLIALLLIAAAATTFFILRKGKASSSTDPVDKQLLLGKWEPAVQDSVAPFIKGSSFEFQKEGIFILKKDSLPGDTAYYEWNKEGKLFFSLGREDSAKNKFDVVLINKDSLQLRSTDSVETVLLRIKD